MDEQFAPPIADIVKATAATFERAPGITSVAPLSDAAVPLLSIRGSASTVLQSSLLGGDANPAFKITGDGTIQWGAGGASALDTKLYRVGANELQTDGGLRAAKGLTTFVKDGAPVDADMPYGTVAGTLAVDNANKKLYVRMSDRWYSVTVT